MLGFLQSLVELLTLIFKAIFHGKKKQKRTSDQDGTKKSDIQDTQAPRRRRRASITETTTTTTTTEFVVSGDSSGSSPTLPDKTTTKKVRFKE